MTIRAANIFANIATPEGAGEIALQKLFYDFADPAYSGDVNLGDKLQIGLVPRGHKLVPHLCRLDMLAIDSGSPTSDYTIGDDTTTNALKTSTAGETAAATLFGEDFALATAEIGSNLVDTPIYIYVTTADSATPPTTGKINFWQVIRPFDSNFDVAS